MGVRLEQGPPTLTSDRFASLRFAILDLVDMRGADRAVNPRVPAALRDSSRLTAAANAFGAVVDALARRVEFVPFRNSKFTRLLAHHFAHSNVTFLFCAANRADTAQEAVASFKCALLFSNIFFKF